MGKRLGRYRARAYGIHGHRMAETAVADDNDHLRSGAGELCAERQR
jgi:hypothetical protein